MLLNVDWADKKLIFMKINRNVCRFLGFLFFGVEGNYVEIELDCEIY
jgi:hypothetical protein